MLPFFLRLCFVLIISAFFAGPAKAVALTYSDINTGGVSGSGTLSSGTYSVNSAGTGLGASQPGLSAASDSFGYFYTATSGNIEVITKISSDASTAPYASSGLMVRTALTAAAPHATITASPQNGCNFIQRMLDGTNATQTLGPSVTPTNTWLRLVVSGTTGNIAGYTSPDGESWQLVGSCTLSLSSTYYIGIAVSSNTPATAQQSQFTPLSYMTNVPQKSANLLLWVRSDAGVVTSGSNVSKWTDQSGNGFNASISSNFPTLTTNAINGVNAVSFNGTNQALEIGPGFSNLGNGFSIFVVYKPAAFVSGARLIDIGSGSAANSNIAVTETSSTTNSLNVYNGATNFPVANSAGMTVGQFQSLELLQSSTTAVTMFTNASQNSAGGFTIMPQPVVHTNTAIGASATLPTPTNFFNGSIAEILVFSGKVSGTQRNAIENYFQSKFAIGNTPTLDPPTFSPGNGFYTQSQTVTISASPGAQINYGLNGAPPTTLYSGPFVVSSSTQISAVASETGFNSSAPGNASIMMDSTTLQLPTTNLIGWYRSDGGVITSSGSNVQQWLDLSGLGNDAVQLTSSNQPTLSPSLFNGYPGLNFSGTGQALRIGGNFNSFANGITAFVVCNPFSANGTVGQAMLSYGPGAVANAWHFGLISTSEAFLRIAAATLVTSTAGTTQLNQPQLEEAVQQSNTVSYFTNGLATGSGAMTNTIDSFRTINYIGQTTPVYAATNFQGNMAEVVCFNASLTSAQRGAWESYLMQRYGLLPSFAAGPVPTPTFAIAAPATFSAPSQIVILGPPGATIYATNDGTTPTTSSPVVNGSLRVSYTQTIKAIAVINGRSSSVLSGTYTVAAATGDTHEFPAPSSADTTTPRVNASLPTVAAP